MFLSRARVIVLAASLLLLTACGAREPQQLRGSSMGTSWQVKFIASSAQADGLQTRIEERLAELTRQMSAWEPDSDLSRFNRAAAGTWQELPPDFFKVLEHALELARETAGAYDPTVAPLVDLWGFGAAGTPRQIPPTPEDIAAAQARIGWARIALDRAHHRALQPGDMRIDVNSIAPGYAVDALATLLRERGIQNFLVELGGEIHADGSRADGTPWQVAVEDPQALSARSFDTIVALRDAGLGTSGDYRAGFDYAGRHYPHTIDPRTGEPVQHRLAAVTVIAPTTMAADARAAALLVLGPDAGMEFARRHGLAAVFTLRTPSGSERRTTPAFEAWRAR